MDELNMLRKKVLDLEKHNRLFKEIEIKLHATNQQLQAGGQQLKSKQEALVRTQRIARIGSWEWEVASDTVTWSDEMFHIFKLNPEDGAVSYADHPKIYTPSSMLSLDTAVQHTLKTGEPYEIDLEIIRADGTNAFCTARGYAEKDKEGKIVLLFGSFQDITERKNAEGELKKSEERLRTVIDNNPFPIAVVDEKDHHIQYWSKSAIQLFGHHPKTVEEWYELAYPNPEYRQEVVERWKPFLEIAKNTTDAVNTGEYEIHCKDGSVKNCELYAQFIPGSLIVTLNDITARKKTEDHLKRIEWLLLPKKEKSEIKIPEYGDLTTINQNRTILDSVGTEVLNGIVSDYLSLLETSAAVYEKNGDYAVGIFSSEWCQFMDCSSRKLCKTKHNKKALESGKWLCHESCWADASSESMQSNKAVDIECSGGLHIYAIPIRANNEVIGSINFGYGNPPIDVDKLKKIATNFKVSEDKLRDIAQRYETRPAFIIDIAKEKLEYSAMLIGNIVERKQMEEDLQRNQKRYKKAQAIGHVGNWEYNPVSADFWASDEAKRVYGYDMNLENFSTEMVESCIPERERVHQALIDLLEHNKEYNLVFDIISMDKGIRKTIHSIAELERDADGNPLKVTGVISDITVQKKADDKLKALNQQLLANEQQLKASNQQLQANEQQLKAANQQLISREQELLAANQQLQANEQQLKAANQQLQASEQQLKASNESLIASEKQYRSLFDSMQEGFYLHRLIYDEQGNACDYKIIEANPISEEYLKIKKEDAIGKLATELYGTKEAPFIDIYSKVAETGEPISFEQYFEPMDKHFFISVFSPQKGDFATTFLDITERKQAEKIILQTQYYLTKAQEIGNFGTWELDLLKNQLNWTDESYKIFEIPTGTPMTYDLFLNCVHPEDRDYVNKEWNTSLKNKPYDIEHRLLLGKQVKWVREKADIQFDDKGNAIKAIGFTQDISERKQIELEIKESLKREKIQADIVRNSPIAIAFGYPDGRLANCNKAFTSLCGYSQDELTKIDWNKKLTPTKWNKIEAEELDKLSDENNLITYEKEYIHKDGTIIPIELVVTARYDEDKNLIHFIGFISNISERRKAGQELIAAKEKAEESDRLKSAFLANMSHEIRTPMNGILGFSNLLKESKLSGEEQQKYIGIIEKSGARMLNIINDIIDISKIEAGLMTMDIKHSNINEQIEYIYTFFKPEVEAKGMKLFLKNTLPANEAFVKTDREKVFAILTNLVKNAIKYTLSGSITIGYQKKDDSFEFFVRDTGIGIPKNRQKSIFERFIQGEIEDNMARQGAGLGLAITKAYVKMLGGEIWVESEEGKGSIFYFTIPNLPIYKNEMSNKNMDDKGVESLKLNLKILIAEDDETSEMLLEILLQSFDNNIIKVGTGFEAIEACRKHPEFDLIFMDIQMPEMNGYEATRQIRKFNNEVVIIAQTAYGLAGDREKAIEAGCNDYISKPINKEELVPLIHKHMNQ